MAHKHAKLLLEHAETFLGRTEAIETALSLGMPLNEIQDYLDWLDQTEKFRRPAAELPTPPPPHKEGGGEDP
jgi:DNA-binding transcriptional MerR regulator